MKTPSNPNVTEQPKRVARGSLRRMVLRLADSWERKARELQRAAKDSDNELLAASADTRLQDVWELRAEIKKAQNEKGQR